jgi:hypothetical protein
MNLLDSLFNICASLQEFLGKEITDRFQWVLTMAYNVHGYRLFGLCPSPDILKKQNAKQHFGNWIYFLPRASDGNARQSPKNPVTLKEITVETRGGSRVGTVELQHPLLPLDIIDNI